MEHHRLIEEITAQLDRLADPQRSEQVNKTLSTSLTLKGIPTPQVRSITREMNLLFEDSPPEEVVEFAKLLKATRILEAQSIAYEMLEKNKTARRSLTLDDLLTLGEGMDNWGSVDSFAVMLAGPAWRDGQVPDEVIESWAVSEDRWWRRAAVVCTVPLNRKARGGMGDIPRTLKICELVVADQDDMVAKGLSWALRELAKRQPAPVVEFVDRHENRLPKRVIREVRRKIATGRK